MNLIEINRESGIPLIGLAYIGVLVRNNNNLIQVRPTTLCNLNCPFCSTDSGLSSRHNTQFNVELKWLLEWIKEVVDYTKADWVHIDSVGEPFMYKDLIGLIKESKKINGVKKVSVITNGSLLDKKEIKQLEDAGLDRINVSLHSLDKEKSKLLFGSNNYKIDKVADALKLLARTKIELWLTPVYMPGVNDNDVEGIIKFAKEINCRVCLQKYEIHKFGRKMKHVKIQNYYKFYKALDELEKKFGVKLKLENQDMRLKRVRKIPVKLEAGKTYDVDVKENGWFSGQMIGVAENRAVTIMDCGKKSGSRIKAKVLENKNNIYIVK